MRISGIAGTVDLVLPGCWTAAQRMRPKTFHNSVRSNEQPRTSAPKP